MRPAVIAVIVIAIGAFVVIIAGNYYTQNTTGEMTMEPIVSPPNVDLGSEFTPVEHQCSGSARCITGIVTTVVDGDTIKIGGQSIRFALASAPELTDAGGIDAKNFVEGLCHAGSKATADEDDGQTLGSYGRIVAVVYCNGINLNEAILDADHGVLSLDFCGVSEFSGDFWAKRHGC